MTEPELQEQIDAAHAYESLFVPALFGQWAERVVQAAGVQEGQRVLDVACGTGVLARAASERVGAAGRVVGLDPNPGMLRVAEELAPGAEWREGVAESLPFPDESFDRVLSQFGLMFFQDRPQAVREMRRVLAPGGRLVIAVWDSLDNNPAYARSVALLEQTAGRRAADALRAPFVLGQREALAALVAQGGVSSAEITTHQGTARFASLRAMVEADLRGWLPVMGVHLSEDVIERTLEEAERALGAYVDESGQMTFDLSALFVTDS